MAMGIGRLIAHPKTFVKRKLAWHAWNIKTHRWGRKVALPEMFEMRDAHVQGFLLLGLIAALAVVGMKHVWVNVVPYGFFDFWQMKGSLSDALWTSRYVLFWGVGITAFFSFITRNEPAENRQAEDNYAKGICISLMAGVGEEIVFRWLYFMLSICLAVIGNFCFFGFLGFGLVEFVQVKAMGPIADFFTLGLLHEQINNPANWTIGAGLLGANSSFRDGHKYLGFFGYVNSWFIGMFFFYLLFTYGLVAAILVHFLYDFAIFTVRYIDQVIERAQGNA